MMDIFFTTGKKVEAQFRGFSFKTDQPVKAGGEGSAPSPFDFFLASLGTCAGFFVLSFCQARGIPTDGINLVLSTRSNPVTHMIEHISIEIRLPDTFPEKYKNAVIRSAQSCTVKKHMENVPEFDIFTSSVKD